MTSKLRRALLISGCVLAFFFSLAIAFFLLVDVDSYKSRFEAAASGTIGMDVRINGKMGIVLFPRFGVSFNNVSIKNRGIDFLTADRMTVAVELVPLIRHMLVMNECAVVKPKIIIARDRNGVFNFERMAPEERRPFSVPFRLGKLIVSKGDFVYSDGMSRTITELKGVDLTLKDLSFFSGGNGRLLLQNISFSGDIACSGATSGNFRTGNVKAGIRADNGIIDIGPIVMELFGKAEKGNITVNVKGERPLFSVRYTASLLDFEKFRKTVSDGSAYGEDILGKKAISRAELTDVDLSITSLSLGKTDEDFARRASLSGNFRCWAVITKDFQAKNIKFDISGKEGIFVISPITFNFFGGTEHGTVKADLRGKSPSLKVQFTASQFSAEEFISVFSRKRLLKGPMNFSLDIAAQGRSFAELKKSMSGEASLKGDNLILYGMDLDQWLAKVEAGQNFSLVDVGAFFLAGPIGPLVARGYDFAGIYAGGLGEQGKIRKLASIWKIKNGVAEAQDVALATNVNRIALKGRLDLVNSRFDDVVVAALDKKGCPRFSQKIEGPFSAPRTEKISALVTIVSPVLKIFEETVKIIEGGKCKVFYKGSVMHPV